MHKPLLNGDLTGAANALTFGQRLTQERRRTGLTQAEMASQGGVARTTQQIYESDHRSPDVTYLERIREVGVDLGYLVTGERGMANRPDVLSISFPVLLNIFRTVDELCVDGEGKPMPVETRARSFEQLCVSWRDQVESVSSVDSLRAELARLTRS